VCRRLKSLPVFVESRGKSKGDNFNCFVLLTFDRRLSTLTSDLSNTKTCAYFQSCAFRLTVSLPCGIHNFHRHLTWDVVEGLVDTEVTNFNSISAGLSGNVFPLWLLPCEGECSGENRCFWGSSRLFQFSLDANWDSEDIEASSGYFSEPNGSSLERVFSTAIPNVTWQRLKTYFNTSSILFVGDSTLRGLMYALLSRVNGSLNFWEASHDLLFFKSKNGAFFHHKEIRNASSKSVVIGFAYFPIFWRKDKRQQDLIDVISHSVDRLLLLGCSGKT
uniref:CST complex subunit CTC1 n=1 Tax=Mesocestoides corti TaxID=53468 RepID=A0A5K3EY04_MESCO